MQPFPPPHELQFFVGRRLEVILLGQFSAIFQFDGENWIRSDFKFSYRASSGVLSSHHVQDKYLPDPISCQDLLGRLVERISVANTILSVVFDDGSELLVETEIGPYEAGSFGQDGQFHSAF